MAKADVLLYFAEPETHPDLAPKAQSVTEMPTAEEPSITRKRPHALTLDDETKAEGTRTSKRARIPTTKALEASKSSAKPSKAAGKSSKGRTSKNRSTAAPVDAGLYMMSGALQSPTPDRESVRSSTVGAPNDQPGPSVQALLVPEITIQPPTSPPNNAATASIAPTPAPTNSTTTRKRKAVVLDDVKVEDEEEQAPVKRAKKTTRAPKAPKAADAQTKKQDDDGRGDPPAGFTRNPRGKLVSIAESEKMKQAWKKRQEKGTSGRHGGAPKKETVEKNKAKGVDYKTAADTYKG